MNYDIELEGLDIKLDHMIMMLTELLEHVPVDEKTRKHFDEMRDSFNSVHN